METVTQWFEMEIHPHHTGVYEILHKRWGGKVYSLWDGNKWNVCSPDIEEAFNTNERSDDCYQDYVLAWRGLADDPEERSK